MSDDITELGLNLLIQQITASFTWDILRLSPSFNSMIHFCSKDRAAYKTSDDVLGYDLSIAILFLVTQRVQENLAKRNMRSRDGKALLPCNQSSENDFRERGTDSKSKTSFKIAQIILARTQSNKI
jgi:hypothetical protein